MQKLLAPQVRISDWSAAADQVGAQAGGQIENYFTLILVQRQTANMATGASPGQVAAAAPGCVPGEVQLVEVDRGETELGIDVDDPLGSFFLSV